MLQFLYLGMFLLCGTEYLDTDVPLISTTAGFVARCCQRPPVRFAPNDIAAYFLSFFCCWLLLITPCSCLPWLVIPISCSLYTWLLAKIRIQYSLVKTKVIQKKSALITMKLCSYHTFGRCVRSIPEPQPSRPPFRCLHTIFHACCMLHLSCCVTGNIICLRIVQKIRCFQEVCPEHIIHISSLTCDTLPPYQKMHNKQQVVTMKVFFLLSSLNTCYILFCCCLYELPVLLP